eukprot:TRINITY_DN5967_c2_g1_i1.p2 TRINITY_DN5967_c2_g1~~TRINITY_DN5967_c2_g1_i1.p2  ORF type:complete len:100 (-),score=18.59 TRINITY_DN5967_c2_g1_i1:187-486(-)
MAGAIGMRRRLNRVVDFPIDHLDMSKYMSPKVGPSEVDYSLFAVSHHVGDVGYGHYTATAQHPNTGLWHYFNDGDVRPANPSSLRGKASPYVLFYVVNR